MSVSNFTEKFGLNLKRKLLKDIYKVFGTRMRVLISAERPLIRLFLISSLIWDLSPCRVTDSASAPRWER